MIKNNLRNFFLGCKECVLEQPRSFYGNFTFGPFKNSQSLTIANALRRVLLTEIQNIAITHVEIAGVLHEYSLLEGVRESVFDILLNFKGIVLKTSLPFEKPLFGYLNVRGPGIIRASDLKLPPNVYCVDPDQYIATLMEDGHFSLKFIISDFCHFSKEKKIPRGKTFLSVSAGKNDHKENSSKESFQKAIQTKKNEKSFFSDFSEVEKQNFLKTSNLLSVDPNFNPILKVSYIIENLEPLGQNIENSFIHFEIWTNGSIHPRKAVYFTFDFLKNIVSKFDEMKSFNKKVESRFLNSEEIFMKILKSYEYDFGFYQISNSQKFFFAPQKKSFFEMNAATEKPTSFLKHEKGVEKRTKERNFLTSENMKLPENKNFHISIDNLNLPFRIYYCLIQNKIFMIEDLFNFSSKELQNFCGFGNFSLALIQKKLTKRGLSLKIEK